MQPNIFMWGGLLKSLIDSDLHIVLDIVKSSKNSRYNRNKIAGNTQPIWLTIPYINFKRDKKICDQKLDTSKNTTKKLINSFTERYSEARYFNKSLYLLENTLCMNKDISNLSEVYLNFLNTLKDIGTPLCKIKFASDLFNENYEFKTLNGVHLVNKILEITKAETYLASENTIHYAEPYEYNISELWIQKFTSKEYLQFNFKEQKSFEPNLSILDIFSYLNIEEITKNLHESNYWKKIKN